MSEEQFIVSGFVRVKNFVLRGLWMSLLFGLVYLIFLSEGTDFGLFYIIIASGITLWFSVKNFMKGTSFIIKKDALEVLRTSLVQYSAKQYTFVPKSSSFGNLVIRFTHKEIMVYKNDELVDVIDCNALSQKKFMKVRWLLKDMQQDKGIAIVDEVNI